MLPRIAFADGNIRPLLTAPVERVTLTQLIDRRVALTNRWDRLREARWADDGEGDGDDSRWTRIGNLMARCQQKVGALDRMVGNMLDHWGHHAVYHAGLLVEVSRLPGRSAARRVRYTPCPRACEVGPLPVRIAAGMTS